MSQTPASESASFRSLSLTLPEECSATIATIVAQVRNNLRTIVPVERLIEAGKQACNDALTLLQLSCESTFRQTTCAIIREAIVQEVETIERESELVLAAIDEGERAIGPSGSAKQMADRLHISEEEYCHKLLQLFPFPAAAGASVADFNGEPSDQDILHQIIPTLSADDQLTLVLEIRDYLGLLDIGERALLSLYYQENLTLQESSHRLHTSWQHAWLTQVHALLKLRSHLRRLHIRNDDIVSETLSFAVIEGGRNSSANTNR